MNQYGAYASKFIESLVRLALVAVLLFPAISQSWADVPKTADKTNTTTKSSPDNSDSEDFPSSAKGSRRDPFLVPAKVIRTPKVPKANVKPEPQPLPAPNIEERVTEYKKALRDHLEGRRNEPSKLAPYLSNELVVTGIFRNEEGYGAFVIETATQKQQTYFARNGWQIYDGYIKEILPTGIRLVKTIRLDNGTVRQIEEFRALPPVNAK